MKYVIGDKLYGYHRRYNINRNKIRMTDADGVEWYRYDSDSITMTKGDGEIVGYELNVVEGQWDDGYSREGYTSYSVKTTLAFTLLEVNEDMIDSGHGGSGYHFFTTPELRDEAYEKDLADQKA